MFENLADLFKKFCTYTVFLAVVMFLPALKYIIKADYWGGLTVVPIVILADFFFLGGASISINYTIEESLELLNC